MRTFRVVVLVVLLTVGGVVSAAAYGPVVEPHGVGGSQLAYGPVVEPNGVEAAPIADYGPMIEPNGNSVAYGPMIEPGGLRVTANRPPWTATGSFLKSAMSSTICEIARSAF